MHKNYQPEDISSIESCSGQTDYYSEQPDYPISAIIRNRDSDEPLECCRKFMLELVHQQMRKLILNAEDVARARNQSTIGYVEILFAFRRHPVFIKRLIQYMRLNDSFSSLAYSLSDAAPECKLDVGSNASDERNQRSKSLLEALKEMDVADELNQMLESTSPDETKIERIRRMTLRIQHMDTVAYEKFAIARTTSFCSRKGKKSQTYSKYFLEWLGSPNVENGIVYILNYCAIEIVAIITDSALFCREEEAKGIFEDEHPTQSLQMRHYEEALRRNRGYALRKDILFGHF